MKLNKQSKSVSAIQATASHNVFNSDIGCMQYWIYLAVRGQLVTFNLLPLCIAAPSKGEEPDAQPLPVSNYVLLLFHVHLQLTAPLLIVRLSINLHNIEKV